MNIDPSEKEKFNKIADEWWDPYGKFAPLHVINPLRSNYVSEKVNLQDKNVIDVASVSYTHLTLPTTPYV